MAGSRDIACLLLLAACSQPAEPPERIVLVVIDTLRRDQLSCYGGDQPTPNLDALAARGQAIKTAIASFHQTSMSMGALFTGRTPSLESGSPKSPLPWQGATWCGMARFAEIEGPDQCIPGSLTTLGERLQEAGYWTIGIASNQFLYEPSGFGQGFDDWVELGEKQPEMGPLERLQMDSAPPPVPWTAVNEAAAAAIARRPRDRVFLYVHYMDVHDYGRQSGAGLAERKRAYWNRIATVDAAVGRLLRLLDDTGLLDRSVVVVTSDHGENLGELHPVRGAGGHLGNPSYQEMLEIPLIVAPAVLPGAPGMIRTQDLFHHLLRIAGLEPEAAGELVADELWIGETAFRTYVRDGWKSVVRRSNGASQLYDLRNDPRERRDVAQRHPEVVEAHMKRIDDLTRRLSAAAPARRELSDDERARLRALGYLD